VNDGFELPLSARARGWRELSHEDACLVLDQIQGELPAGHRLKGAMLVPVARRLDEVLVRIVRLDAIALRQAVTFAIVRRTSACVMDPRGPAASYFDSIDDWLVTTLNDDDDGATPSLER
jgi:hypothetical protein